MSSRPCALLLALPLLAAPAFATADGAAVAFARPGETVAAKALVSGCDGGEVHDDGLPENAYGWAESVGEGRYVEKLTPAAYPWRYTGLCVCWVRNSVEEYLPFEVVAFADDGADGGPGTELAALPAEAFGVLPALPGEFVTVDLTPLELMVSSGSVWLGVRWSPAASPGFFVCADESPATARRDGLAWADGDPWTPTGQLFGAYRSLLLRATGARVPAIEVPTLDLVGLGALLAVLGAAAFLLLRRRAAA